jgi:hypothetical protein
VPAWMGTIPPSPTRGTVIKSMDICRGEPCVRPDLLLAISIGIPLDLGEHKVRPYVGRRVIENALKIIASLINLMAAPTRGEGVVCRAEVQNKGRYQFS